MAQKPSKQQSSPEETSPTPQNIDAYVARGPWSPRNSNSDIDCQKAAELNGAEVEALTKQAPAQETDVNYIVRQHSQTGLITHLAQGQPQFGDFSDVTDYQDALNRVIAAQDSFDSMDATIRKRFNNDPAQLIAALNDPSQQEDLIKLGIVNKPDKEEPVINEQPPANPV